MLAAAKDRDGIVSHGMAWHIIALHGIVETMGAWRLAALAYRES